MTKNRASSGPEEMHKGPVRTPGFRLQPRDEDVLVAVFAPGCMARRHVESLFFGSTPRCNAKLLQYVRAGLLHRFHLSSDPGGGQAIYRLAAGAYPIVARRIGLDIGEVRRICRARNHRHVEHTLGILDLRIALQDAVREQPGLRLDLWLSELECRHAYQFVRGRAVTQRVFKPDAYARLAVPNDSYVSYFIEYDRAHASAAKFAQTVTNHVSYRATGLFGEVYADDARATFTTLVVTTGGERRLARLLAVAHHQQAGFFRFVSEQDVVAQGFFAPVWRMPGRRDPTSLLARPE